MNFPDSPSVGNLASNGITTWQWNGNAWDKVSIEGQAAAVFVPFTLVQTVAAVLPGMVSSFNRINYV